MIVTIFEANRIVEWLVLAGARPIEELALFRGADLDGMQKILFIGGAVTVSIAQARGLSQVWAQRAKKAGVSDDDRRQSQSSRNADRASTLPEQLAWLQAAGFADVDC
jgi:hypothetical protein